VTRAVVFDLDGTLVDSVADITHALNRAFAGASLPPLTEAQVEPALGHGALELVRSCVRRVAPDARADDTAFVAALCEAYLAAYAAQPAPFTRLYADAATALPALRDAGIALGVCTNKDTALSWEVLAAVGLDEVVSVVRGRDATEHPKPDPRHLLETVAELGARPEDVVYVGDNPVDVAVARGAGVRYRHVAWGVPVDDEVEPLERFAELQGEECYAWGP
jgi:phosphoglycolate phosphatase